jgi:uncharacterized repeat protein (TIGR03803 family)
MKMLQVGKTACLLVVLCVAGALASPAQTFTALKKFDGPNGWNPGSLVQGLSGNLYGTTHWGGPFYDEGHSVGWGTVFAAEPTGGFRTVYTFCSIEACADGVNPSNLILAANGNFYGTTFGGGVSSTLASGTVFELTPSGTLTTLYSFCQDWSSPKCLDGSYPGAGLVQGVNGSFYGTTTSGGTGSGGGGILFAITPTGAISTLYSFCSLANCADGSIPSAPLVLASNGDFYGTTEEGGANTSTFCVNGCGTIFKITPAGAMTTVYNFCSKERCADGFNPSGAAMVEGPDGALYGTVESSGGSGEVGLIFRLTLSGKFSVLYTFCTLTNCADGAYPQGGLTLGSDGNFYGTTGGGGANGGGSVFEITPSGSLTTLYSFCAVNCPEGGDVTAPLVQSTSGTFFGTASAGGDLAACDNAGQKGCGTVFSLGTGLGPFVESNPAFGAVGKEVNILGNNLTGTISVTFNGTAATFTVISDTYLKAQVPAGATTGTIQVTTPSGTLDSNAAFQVLP